MYQNASVCGHCMDWIVYSITTRYATNLLENEHESESETLKVCMTVSFAFTASSSKRLVLLGDKRRHGLRGGSGGCK